MFVPNAVNVTPSPALLASEKFLLASTCIDLGDNDFGVFRFNADCSVNQTLPWSLPDNKTPSGILAGGSQGGRIEQQFSPRANCRTLKAPTPACRRGLLDTHEFRSKYGG